MSDDEGQNEGPKPIFLVQKDEAKPNINDKVPKPPDMTWGDYMLKGKGPLSPKHKLLARLVAGGMSNVDVAKRLGYHVQTVGKYISNTRIRREIDRVQERMFEQSAEERMKELTPDALDIVEKHIKDPALTTKEQLDAAKWIIEKQTGKPAQQVEVNGEINMNMVLDTLEKLKREGKVIDVTPTKVDSDQIEEAEAEDVPVDELADWVDKNVPSS